MTVGWVLATVSTLIPGYYLQLYNRWKWLLLYLGTLKLILNVVTENAGIRKEISSIW
jgi:cyanate permease